MKVEMRCLRARGTEDIFRAMKKEKSVLRVEEECGKDKRLSAFNAALYTFGARVLADPCHRAILVGTRQLPHPL